LDSAWRAVYSYLFLTDPTKLPEFRKLWGKNAEWFEKPSGLADEPEGGPARAASLLEKFIRRTHNTVLV